MSGTDVLSLAAVIGASRRLDELSTARVIGEAAEAVHKAQQQGQALGTLSPAAILVSASGSVAIEPPAASLPGYSAPERLRGSPGDRRSDVFSLGVLLWEALAHERLFDGATDEAVKTAVLGAELRPPSACNANVPAELDAICKKALARDPADRYQSAKVMAAEISAVLDDAGYPESNDELARYVAAALTPEPAPAAPQPEPAPAPAPLEPASISAGGTASIRGRSTIHGIVPTRKSTDPGKPTAAAPPDARAQPPSSDAPAPLVLGPIPGVTVEPSAPSMLGMLKPGNQTAILGSIGAAAEPAPPPAAAAKPAPPPAAAAEPAPPPAAAAAEPAPSLAAAAGSSSDDAARRASVRSHDTPPPYKAVAPLAQASSLPSSDDDVSEPKEAPHPASAVSLPRAGSRSDAAKGDPLGGWGWGTDAHQAYDDDAYHDGAHNTRKRLFLAIGGAAGAILLVTVIALAAGGSKSKDGAPAPTAQAATAWDPSPPPVPPPPPAPAPPPPSATDPAPAGSATDPGAPPAAAVPPKPEPAVEPAQPEAAKPEPKQPDPPKVAAKPEPRKPDPPKIAAKPEPRKPDPPKVAAKPEPPKVALAAHKPDKLERPKADATAAKPIDPYATADTKKVDPAAAYRTGLQQFARGDSTGALATFKASLAASPDYAPTWRAIGLVYEKVGQSSQARTAYQRYLKLAPAAGDASQIRERLDKLP